MGKSTAHVIWVTISEKGREKNNSENGNEQKKKKQSAVTKRVGFLSLLGS